MKWIEDHIGFIVLIIGVIIIIEMGIGAYRMPREFRSNIIPKINSIIERNYNQGIRIDMLMDLERIETLGQTP